MKRHGGCCRPVSGHETLAGRSHVLPTTGSGVPGKTDGHPYRLFGPHLVRRPQDANEESLPARTVCRVRFWARLSVTLRVRHGGLQPGQAHEAMEDTTGTALEKPTTADIIMTCNTETSRQAHQRWTRDPQVRRQQECVADLR